ncbi:hypothetical protein P692DRAFT_20730222 [Suillus brevipes Sb2]|jgi:hypothetical protein|nr:hypothetical protein P692DRAFT_20730222 [Suillus brevipes Sb2]
MVVLVKSELNALTPGAFKTCFILVFFTAYTQHCCIGCAAEAPKLIFRKLQFMISWFSTVMDDEKPFAAKRSRASPEDCSCQSGALPIC